MFSATNACGVSQRKPFGVCLMDGQTKPLKVSATFIRPRTAGKHLHLPSFVPKPTRALNILISSKMTEMLCLQYQLIQNIFGMAFPTNNCSYRHPSEQMVRCFSFEARRYMFVVFNDSLTTLVKYWIYSVEGPVLAVCHIPEMRSLATMCQVLFGIRGNS